MIKTIITDTELLSQESEPVLPVLDRHGGWASIIIEHLIDTAKAQKDPSCLGLSANQIGYLDEILVMKFGNEFIPIINPKIICVGGGIKSALENCLSRPGMKPIKARRHKIIKIQYIDGSKHIRIKKFHGLDARVIQHGMDHFKGILI